MLDVSERCRCRVRLFPSEIRLFRSSVHIAINGALEIGLLREDKVEEIIVELVVQIGKHYKR